MISPSILAASLTTLEERMLLPLARWRMQSSGGDGGGGGGARDVAQVILSPRYDPLKSRNRSFKRTKVEPAFLGTSIFLKDSSSIVAAERKFRKLLLALLAFLLVLLSIIRIASVGWLSRDFDQLLVRRPLETSQHAAREADTRQNAPYRTQSLASRKLWETPDSSSFEQCVGRSKKYRKAESSGNGYLLVHANGGLNQMRNGICDMVAVARILNASLVIPSLDHNSFWEDKSKFEEIFDVDHFINKLKDDVHIVKALPPSLQGLKPVKKAPVSWSKPSYYKEEILPVLKKHKLVYFTHADARLANNGVPSSIQRLRCRANYQALRYAAPISNLAGVLVNRMRSKGPYIALHLRYEKDMLAFTGCSHGLSEAETRELTEMRNSTSHWKEKDIVAEERRMEGGCPLTPREVALLLKGLGYPNSTNIYIVAGKIFGQDSMTALRKEFPNVYTHETLAAADELRPLKRYQNRLAAIDYTLALESDVFVYTYDGNMAKAVEGHRRFEGHRKTINPDRQFLVTLVDDYDSGNLTWENFAREVKRVHKKRLGRPSYRQPGELPKTEENFYSNPYPGCICMREGSNRKLLRRQSEA